MVITLTPCSIHNSTETDQLTVPVGYHKPSYVVQ